MQLQNFAIILFHQRNIIQIYQNLILATLLSFLETRKRLGMNNIWASYFLSWKNWLMSKKNSTWSKGKAPDNLWKEL